MLEISWDFWKISLDEKIKYAICNHLENCFLSFESATQNFWDCNNVVIEQSRLNDTL